MLFDGYAVKAFPREVTNKTPLGLMELQSKLLSLFGSNRDMRNKQDIVDTIRKKLWLEKYHQNNIALPQRTHGMSVGKRMLGVRVCLYYTSFIWHLCNSINSNYATALTIHKAWLIASVLQLWLVAKRNTFHYFLL